MASMATAISVTSRSVTSHFVRNRFIITKPRSATFETWFPRQGFVTCWERQSVIACSVTDRTEQSVPVDHLDDEVGDFTDTKKHPFSRPKERLARKETERYTYLVAAIMSGVGVTSLAVVSVYYRFSWQTEGGEVPLLEMFGTFALSVGAAVGMEFWARWAHRALWHASLWHMHESHHRPRDGPFELNDVFAIINAVPAIALLSFGFFNKGLVPGLCFGGGLGITVFGMAYMFLHDGLVHRRFPVGPIANVPYLRRVATAHQLHHSGKFDGVPYGLFLGPKKNGCHLGKMFYVGAGTRRGGRQRGFG